MEKKFKLIKEYPGNSGNIGEIYQTNENGFIIIAGLGMYLENWPEFFEEIKEPLFVTEDGVEPIFSKNQMEAAIIDIKGSTELIDSNNEFCNMYVTACCKIGPIINENYCPNCGRKIIKK